jgi:hypothetical protein
VSARLRLPPLLPADRSLLVKAVAARHQVQLAWLSPASSVLRTIGGNPETIIALAQEALRAGGTTSAAFEEFVMTTSRDLG